MIMTPKISQSTSHTAIGFLTLRLARPFFLAIPSRGRKLPRPHTHSSSLHPAPQKHRCKTSPGYRNRVNARTQTGLRPPDMLLPQSAKNLSLLSNAAPHWLQNLAGEQTPDSYSLPLSDHVLAIYARSSPASYQFCFPVKGSNFGIGWPVMGSNLAPNGGLVSRT